MTRRRPLRVVLGAAVAGVVLTACGTTVPYAQQASLGSVGGGAAGSDSSLGGLPGPAATTAAGSTAGPAGGSASGANPGTLSGVGGSGTSSVASSGTGATGPGSTGSTPGGGTSSGTKPGSKTSAKPSAGASKGTAGKGASSSPTTSATGTINVGYVYVSESSNQAVNAAAGATASSSLTAQGVGEALRDYFNAHGGLDGRQINLVEYGASSTATSFSQDASAACTKMTQDNHVSVVIDSGFGDTGGFDTCLKNSGIEEIDLGYSPDKTGLASDPYEVAPNTLSRDRNYVDVLTQMVKTGVLKSTSLLGILMDNCAPTAAAYTNSIKPAIASLGLKTPSVYTTSCIAGYGGLSQASSDSASAELQFATAGVTDVLVVSQYDPTYWILFSKTAYSQGYKPNFLLTSYAEPRILETGNFDSSQFPLIHGTGNIPGLDTDKATLPGDAASKECEADLATEGQVPASDNDHYVVSIVCAGFLLLRAGMQADGANVTASVLSKAFAGLGTSFTDPGILAGASDSSHQDLPAKVQVFGYSTSCSCLQYSGTPVAS